ncbi:MAG: glycosyltransferase family 2 protein [bacterium]|nr:glycosyltransferase family 2 protein [bacterium]
MDRLPIVSIVIPCRNEERYIDKCLDSIVTNDFPKDMLEVLVIDGLSEDKTREIIRRYSNQYSYIKLLDNQKKIVSTALNLGIKNAKGNIIIRMDAHNIYKKDYISKCVKYILSEYNADNVGGICITLPGNNTRLAKAIALSLSHPFGVGNAFFRIGSKEPKYVDTVPFGCYKREVFDKIGYFDEDLIRNQDDEFNLRLIKSGGKILLVPEIVSYYYARDSLLKLWRMYFQYGYFKPLVVLKVGGVFTWRQLIPIVFISGVIISGLLSFILKPFFWMFLLLISTYSLANLFFSFSLGLQKERRCIFFLPIAFPVIHFSYGLGYLKGILDFVVWREQRRKRIKDLQLTR